MRPYRMVCVPGTEKPDRITKAVARRHHLDGLGPFLDYARTAAEMFIRSNL